MKQNAKKNPAQPFAVITSEQLGGECIGDVRIYGDVIASIIKKSVSEVPGISRISDNSVMGNISGLLNSGKFQNKAIDISFTENGVAVELSVNVFYGTQLQKAASEIQRKLGPQIQKLTGLRVQSIDVVIRGIDEQKNSGKEKTDSEE